MFTFWDLFLIHPVRKRSIRISVHPPFSLPRSGATMSLVTPEKTTTVNLDTPPDPNGNLAIDIRMSTIISGIWGHILYELDVNA